MLLFKFPSGPLETNAILVGCSRTGLGAAIDPSAGSAEVLLKAAQEKGLKIEKILLTHSHWDHFADAHALKMKTGAPLYVHELDSENVRRPGSDGIPLFFPVHPVEVDHFLVGGETVQAGDLQFEVIHTPGHSPGSVCFYAREEKLLISGDTLFCGTIGNLNLPTAHAADMWESLKKLAQLPPDTKVVPGHGGDTEIGREKKWLSRAEQMFSF